MKIKLFTHNDLDGISCGILAILAFGKENVDISYCSYDNIDDKVMNFLYSVDYFNYDYAYITDISINEETFNHIEEEQDFHLINNSPSKVCSFILRDHHPSALWLNRSLWCYVKDSSKETVSGTSMFYEYLLKNLLLKTSTKSLEDFISKVTNYDTWNWAKVGDTEARDLNDLFYIYGTNKFTDEMLERLKSESNFYFTDIDKLILNLENDKKERYIKKMNKSLIRKDLLVPFADYTETFCVGVVFAEQYINDVGNQLALLNTDLDFIIVINLNAKTMSYRGIKDNINLGEIAKAFGGGGHFKASGRPISNNDVSFLINYLFI